jgi:hypothetical protein
MSDEVDEIESGIDQDHTEPLAPALATKFTKQWLQGLNDLNALAVLPSGFWEPKGPAPLRVDNRQDVFGAGPIAGAVVDILIHPDSPNTIFAATGHGGVWRSTNGGVTFQPTMDGLPSLSIGALAIDAVNRDVIYAGCGIPLEDSFSESAGLYKSIDRGLSWSVADGGLFGTVFTGRSINHMISNAANALVVGTSDGLFFSVDGGLNFGSNSPTFDDGKAIFAGTVTSLALDHAAPATTILFCISGMGGSGSGFAGGVYRLDLSTANPAQSLFSNPGAPKAPFGDLVLAQSTQPDAKTLYVSVQFDKPGKKATDPKKPTYIGLFQSVDSGAHWTQRPAAKTAEQADTPPDQTNYDLTVGVDPSNASCVYIGFQELWRSLNGGATFGSSAVTKGKIHFDQHAIAFGPPATPFTPVYVGEDGGLARSDDGGAHWVHLNSSFATNLVFGVDIGRGAGNHDFTYAGMQDTGTAGHRTGDAGLDWHVAVDGDGKRVVVDPNDPNTLFAFDNEFFARSKNGGNTWQRSLDVPRLVGIGLPNKDVVRRIAINPNGNDPTKRVVYVSQGRALFRSTNGGANFAAVTPKVPFTSDITAMEFVVGDANRMWVALADGSIHFTADNLQTWDAAGFPTTPGGQGFITGIAVDPNDNNHDRVAVCYIGFGGQSAKVRTRHVFLRDNATAPWVDISGTDNQSPLANVPDLACYSIAFDAKTTPSTIVVATINAVLCSLDLGKTWRILGVGLPNTSCTSLAMDNVDTTVDPRILRVGTYGRSCFEFTKPAARKLFVEGDLAFPPAAVGQIRSLTLQLFNPGGTDLTVSAITGVTADFQLVTPPPIPVPANSQKPAEFHFTPTAPGNRTATLQIVSDDVASPMTIQASGQAVAAPTASRLAVLGNLSFGEVDTGTTATSTFTVFNTGTKDLKILGVSRKGGSSDFELVSPPGFPLLLSPTIDQEFTVQFKPSSNGPLTATFQIDSDASRASALIEASGTGSSHMSKVLIVVIVIVGAAIVVGGGVAIYEATK